MHSSYRYFVASKHIARFRHVVLNRVDGEGLDVLVASLDRFERLNELTLDGYSARYAFGDHPVFDLDLARPATFRFAQIVPRIRKLHLSDFRPSAAAPYLKVLPFLEYFHYEIDDLWISLEFASLLESLPPIQHLHCEAPDAGGLRSFLAAVTTIPHDWTSLKRLTMTTPFIDLSMLRSLHLFEASLEELELVVEEDDPEGESEDLEDSDVPSWIDDGVRFPHLRSISIINSRGLLAKQFFRPVTKLHLPELRHLRVSHSADCGHGDDFTICTLSRLFEEHEHLKYLEFLAPDSLIAGDHREDIDRILERHEFTVTYRDCPEAGYPADVFLDKSYPIWEPLIERYLRGGKQEEEEEALKESLNRLREYFDRTLVNAEAVRNLPTLYRLAVLLRPLECERLAQFD
ncbi:hypothetical protein JCM16303_004552 [Sporobolomyces ruberrimus]